MKSKNFNFRFIGVFVLITLVASCVSTKDRSPTAAKSQTELQFKLFNSEGLLNKSYNFELLDLSVLSQNRIQFSPILIDSDRSNNALNEWILQIKSFTDETAVDIKFTVNKLPINVKVSDFKRLQRALELIGNSSESANSIARKQIAIISAFNQNFKDPLDLQLEALTFPFEVLKRLNPYTVSERKYDENLKVQNSSFWTERPANAVSMSLGPSELDLAKFDSEICHYAGPKKGFGIHQGIKVKCFDKKFKVKFGEIRSAPLNSKIYHRLGYNVPAIHSIKEIKVNYERRMFTELNSGKQQFIRIKFLGQQIKSLPVRKKADFENHVAFATLKNGDKISTAEFLKKLLPACGVEDQNCHLNESLYDAQFESDISNIVFHEIAIVEESNDHEFGPWAFDELDHKSRTEVRALVLVGAFTGNHDLRKDNNKLLWSAKNSEIKHTISDPGSGYGSGMPFSGFNANEMKWEVMREKVDQQPAEGGNSSATRTSVVIDGYKPSVNHSVFSKLNLGEAKWMARQIAGISEDELTEAQAASGFSVAELLLTREKLISLQKNIVDVLELNAEFPDLAARQINRKMSYESRGEKQIFNLKNGKQLSVEEKQDSLVNGILKRN